MNLFCRYDNGECISLYICQNPLNAHQEHMETGGQEDDSVIKCASWKHEDFSSISSPQHRKLDLVALTGNLRAERQRQAFCWNSLTSQVSLTGEPQTPVKDPVPKNKVDRERMSKVDVWLSPPPPPPTHKLYYIGTAPTSHQFCYEPKTCLKIKIC